MSATGRGTWTRWLSLGLALLVVAAALLLPEPATPPPAAAAGPQRLREAWPAAKILSVPAALPDGGIFLPMAVVEATAWVGLVVTYEANGSAESRLVVMNGAGSTRTVRTYAGAFAPTVAAVVVDNDMIYWIDTGLDADGVQMTTVWRAGLRGGAAEQLARDRAELAYFDSQNDLIIAEDRLLWATTGPNGTGEIRSIPVAGGDLAVRSLDRPYALTTWPWARTARVNQGEPVRLLDLNTGQIRDIAATPDETLACTPAWCRITTLVNQGRDLRYEIVNADGSDRRPLGGGSKTPLNVDVALMDRFEVLGSVGADPDPIGPSVTQQLWLHDLATDRDVLLADAATGSIGSRSGFLWWSTGNNEARVWNVVDLRQLI